MNVQLERAATALPAAQLGLAKSCLLLLAITVLGAGKLVAQESDNAETATLDAATKTYNAAFQEWKNKYILDHALDIKAANTQLQLAQANYSNIVIDRADTIAEAESARSKARHEAQAEQDEEIERLRKKLEFEANEPIRSFNEWKVVQGPKAISLISEAANSGIPYSQFADTH